MLVEACVDSVESAIAAERGGAGRLELCDNLHDGGTTPSAGMIAAVKNAVDIPVFVIVRPRGGGFVYTDAELDVMRRDIEAAARLGADGIVLGALTRQADVDADRIRRLLDVAPELPATFHRAFDLVRDQRVALESIATLGIARVLTSGGATSALDGASTIAELVRQSSNRVTLMAGGGVREENVSEIVRRSGVREVHVRGTRLAHTSMTPDNERVRFRKAMPSDEGAWEETDESRIREIVRLASSWDASS
jgi:copper homeostasis protein